MIRPAALRCMIAVPALLVLLALAGAAAWRGQADFSGREARYRLDQAILGKAAMDETQWQYTRGLLERSLQMQPDDATFHEDLANLHFLRAAQLRGDARQMKARYESALAEYLRAAALRPTSAYTHASIASVKLQLGQFDADFSTALLLATRYGPWESAVQEQVLAAGLRAWAVLSEPARQAVRGNLQRALALEPARTRRYLQANQGSLPPCGQLRLAIPGSCAAP
jgi:hypothetical protein